MFSQLTWKRHLLDNFTVVWRGHWSCSYFLVALLVNLPLVLTCHVSSLPRHLRRHLQRHLLTTWLTPILYSHTYMRHNSQIYIVKYVS